MRWSGMAILDTVTLKRSALIGNVIVGNRSKTHQKVRVCIPGWLADALRALPPKGAEYFFWGGKVQAKSAAQTYYRLLKQAGMKNSHGFRHYFISTTLATGTAVEDVSTMVGTSPAEIRKTYRHYIKEATDRLDRVQEEAWIKQGLDKNGNPRKVGAAI